jgi:H-type lectin domain
MIQTGMAGFGVDSPDWNLNTGIGERSFRTPDVSFDPPFDSAPHVVLAIGGVDIANLANLRLGLEAYDVEPGEFSIRIRTWSDTQLYNVLVTWIAHD